MNAYTSSIASSVRPCADGNSNRYSRDGSHNWRNEEISIDGAKEQSSRLSGARKERLSNSKGSRSNPSRLCAEGLQMLRESSSRLLHLSNSLRSRSSGRRTCRVSMGNPSIRNSGLRFKVRACGRVFRMYGDAIRVCDSEGRSILKRIQSRIRTGEYPRRRLDGNRYHDAEQTVWMGTEGLTRKDLVSVEERA